MRFVALVALLVSSTALAAPPEPKGAHPRMLVDAEQVKTWKALAKLDSGPVVGAIKLCEDGKTTEHDRAVYMGSEWSRVLQACLVAYVATDKPEYAKTATKFFTALIDDVDKIGDGGGGDTAARRDSGYAIRNLGPYTALAYDWLYSQLPEPVRARARSRWSAWLTWYRDKGYRARQAGTNYQAGYLAAATMIAVAQAGDAKDTSTLWTFVADQLWGHDMAEALAPGGILDGGDWPEGWQYGPLSIAHYALAARVATKAGISVPGMQRWLHAVLQRHLYALSPSDKLYVAQDTEAETPHVTPNVLTLDAIALGDAAPADRRAARAELARLQLTDKDYFLYDALASTDTKAEIAALDRATLPTLYRAGTGALYTRTRWDGKAVWLAAECGKGLPVDHRQPKAGSFVLSRGADDAIVDPSPYGTASTLTSNAPTVTSPHFPTEYQPSQGMWGTATWTYTTQTKSGVVAARCDYAGAYKLQEQPTDVKFAERDLVLLPSSDGTAASLLVLDRARTASAATPLHLQFHVVGGLALANDAGEKLIGSTRIDIAPLAKSSGKAVVVVPSGKDCFAKDVIKGKCTAARFEASAYHVEVAGPEPFAAHLISVTDQRAPAVVAKPLPPGTIAASTTSTVTTGARSATTSYAGFSLTGPRAATIVWPTAPGGSLHYLGPAGTHVVLDAPNIGGMSTVKTTQTNGACDVTVTPGGNVPSLPLIMTLDAKCAFSVDAATPPAVSSTGPGSSESSVASSSDSSSSAGGTAATPSSAAASPSSPSLPTSGHAARAGCCAASDGPASPIVLGALVALVGFRRRR
ncbi:MAG TPA: hypothetical protein VGM39_04230 [Kofleriaceae bacterium]|jgi:hypothetical protein